MPRNGRSEAAVGRKEHVAAGEKRPRSARPAENAVETSDDRFLRRVHVELGSEAGVRDRHDQAGRHSVARRISEEHGHAAVRQQDEIVEIAAHRVCNVVEGGDVVSVAGGRHLRNQSGLEVPCQRQFVPVSELVDELHRQQDDHEHERARDVRERGEVQFVEAMEVPEDRQKEPDERDDEDDPAHRREALGQAVKQGAGRVQEPPHPASLARDLLFVLGQKRLARFRPVACVQIRDLVGVEVTHRVRTEVEPVADDCHNRIVRGAWGQVLAAWRA